MQIFEVPNQSSAPRTASEGTRSCRFPEFNGLLRQAEWRASITSSVWQNLHSPHLTHCVDNHASTCLMSLPISHNPQSLPRSLHPISNQYIKSISTFSRQKLPPGAQSNYAGALSIGKPPISPASFQHVTACMAHESARIDSEARAPKPRVSNPKQAPLSYTPHFRSTIPAPEAHVTDPYQRPHLRTDEAQRPGFPNPFSIAKKTILQGRPTRARFKRSYKRLQESM